MTPDTKRPGLLDKARDNVLFDYGLNQNQDIKQYLEFKKLQYGQNTLTAAFNQFFHEAISKDLEYQAVIRQREQKGK